MRKFLNKFSFFGLIVFFALLTVYSDSQSQVSSLTPPCPACYKEEDGKCVPADSSQDVNDPNGKGILDSKNNSGGGFAKVLKGIGGLFGGNSGSSAFNVKAPNCGANNTGFPQGGWKFPAEVTSKAQVPTPTLPSGRPMSIGSWNPTVSGGVELTQQYHPEELLGANTVSSTLADVAQNHRMQWRGGCGRGIFLYESMNMKNSNKPSIKAAGGDCTEANYDAFSSSESKCRVSAEDLATQKTWHRNALSDSKRFNPRIYSNDIWLSRTGCYNPEERFVLMPSYPALGYYFALGDGDKPYQHEYFEPMFSSFEAAALDPLKSLNITDDVKFPGPLDEPKHYRYSDPTQPSKLWRPKKGSETFKNELTGESVTTEVDKYADSFVPNDRLFMRHHMCMMIDGQTPNLVAFEKSFAAKNKGIIRSISTNRLIDEGRLPVCLQTNESVFEENLYDMLDETESFCKEFLAADKVQRYYNSNNCWESRSLVIAPGPYDHWMPKAVKSGSKTRKDYSDPDASDPSQRITFSNSVYSSKAGKLRTDRLAYFSRVTSKTKSEVSSEIEDVRYVVREYTSNLSFPTFTPHSMKNAFNNPLNPEYKLVGGNEPYGPRRYNTQVNPSICREESGVKRSGSGYNVEIDSCIIAANRTVQGEYGYRDFVIERGPFRFSRMDPDNSASDLVSKFNLKSPRGGVTFSFDEAAQMLRGAGGSRDYEAIDRSVTLKYLPGRIIPIDYAFNPYNIYSPIGPSYSADMLNQPEHYGRKYKNQQCLRLFIEKWAFEGDKGNIVVNRNMFRSRSGVAHFKPDISYCQWSAYYAASSGLPESNPAEGEYQRRYKVDMLTKLTTEVFGAITGALNGIVGGNTKVDLEYPTRNLSGFPIKRPLNSEFYDYLNFATMGSIELADESGCNSLNCFIASNLSLGSLFEDAGIDLGEITKAKDLSNNAIAKWQAGEIDLAKRDCNTMVPPNYTRDSIRPFERCDGYSYGWWRLRNPIKTLFCLSGNCTVRAAAQDNIGALTGGRDNGGGLGKVSGLFEGLLGNMTDDSSNEDPNNTDKGTYLSFLTTEVDTPIFSLVTPIIQGLPTIGMGMKFPVENDSGQENDSGSEQPESGSFPDLSGGGSGNKGDGMPDTGTVDLKVLYFQWSMPPLKLILRDNWLSRMGGIRVVPYNIISKNSGGIEVEGPEENYEEKWSQRKQDSNFLNCSKSKVCCTDNELNKYRPGFNCQDHHGENVTIRDVRREIEANWVNTDSCSWGCDCPGDQPVCEVQNGGAKTVAKKQNFAGLPMLQFKEAKIAGQRVENIPAGHDWYDHTLSARSCQHTILSALLGDFAGELHDNLREAWSNTDDISLLATINAVKALPGIITSFGDAISEKNFAPVLDATKIYGGFKVFRTTDENGNQVYNGPEEDGDGTDITNSDPDVNTKEVDAKDGDGNTIYNTDGTTKKRKQYKGSERYKKFFSWFPSPWSFTHGQARSFWCEFQLPYNPYYQGEQEWNYGKTPILGHGNLNSYVNVPFIRQNGVGSTAAKIGGMRPKLTYYRPERIRDGCGAFAVRATWMDDKENDLANFLIGKNKGGGDIHKSRCGKWEGMFGAQYDDPKIISWRLPRFDYEFLKSFLECTGPVRTAPQNCYQNKYARNKNITMGTLYAVETVVNTVGCIYSGKERLCKGIVNAALKTMDFFTRGDTWYGKVEFFGVDVNSVFDDAQNIMGNDHASDLDDQVSGNKGADVMDEIKESMNDQMMNVLGKGGTISNDGKVTTADGEVSGVPLGDMDDEMGGKVVNVTDICTDHYKDAKDSDGNDISASAIATCVTEGEKYKASLTQQIGQSANNGNIQVTSEDSSSEEVGDLSCYERNIKNTNAECFHGGKKSIITKQDFGDADDDKRKVACQDCSMQISNFWRVKASEELPQGNHHILRVKESYGTNEPFGFWCTCPQDNSKTTRCREDMCTCDQHVMFIGRSLGGIDGDSDSRKKINKQIKKNLRAMEKLDPSDANYDKKMESLQKQNQSLIEMRDGTPNTPNVPGATRTSSWSSPWAFCKDYGPMRRWLQCYYQARARACPVLTREVSDTEPPANLMNNLRFSDSLALVKKTETTKNLRQNEGGDFLSSIRTGEAPIESTSSLDSALPQKDGMLQSCGKSNATGLNLLSLKFARWMAEEPNHLARLPVRFESAGASFKHQDFVFQSQTRDIEAPFMEMSVPFPIDLLSRGTAANENTIEIAMLNERGTAASDVNAPRKEVYLVKGPRGNELGEIISRGSSYEIDIGQLLAPKSPDGKLNKKYWDLAVKFEAGVNAAHIAYLDKSKPVLDASFQDHDKLPLRAQDAVVGPRGCDIGGWYEMMLYQARCIKFFGLNCVCDYDKTFARGDAKAYVLGRAGMEMNAIYPVMLGVQLDMTNISRLSDQIARDSASTEKSKVTVAETSTEKMLNKKIDLPRYTPVFDKAANDRAAETATGYTIESVTKAIPLMDRGIVGPEFALGVQGSRSRPDFRLWDKGASYKGLDHVMVGDIMMYDESITYNDGTFGPYDAGYPRHVAYVNAVYREASGSNKGRPYAIQVYEMNWGKNVDSCGVTDTWSVRTSRTLMRPEELDKKLNERVQKYASCQNADWKRCEEKYWDQVRLYRPYKIVPDSSGGYGAEADPAYPVCTASIAKPNLLNWNQVKKRLGLPSDSSVRDFMHQRQQFSVKEVVNDYNSSLSSTAWLNSPTGNKWLYSPALTFNSYDLREVDKYINDLSTTIGTCDPEPTSRDNFKSVVDDYIAGKDYLSTLP
jgi:hypothetical protein